MIRCGFCQSQMRILHSAVCTFVILSMQHNIKYPEMFERNWFIYNSKIRTEILKGSRNDAQLQS